MVRWTHFDASWRMTMRKDIIPFDWCVTTHGDVGQAFRIFTSNVPVVHNTFDMEVKEDGTYLVIATDGSCSKNGEADTHAGSGIYVRPDHAWK